MASRSHFRTQQPGRHVTISVQYAPEVHVINALDVEDQVGVAPQLAAAQAGEVEFVPMAGGPSESG